MPYVENRKRNLSLVLKLQWNMYFQLAIIIILALLLIAPTLWFSREKKSIVFAHRNTLFNLENAISINMSQIDLRRQNLNKYEFLKYNVHDALIIQNEIEL